MVHADDSETKEVTSSISLLTSYIDEHDEQEIRESMEKAPKNSALTNYACRLGTIILLQCVSLQESLSTWWVHVKEYMQSKQHHA